LRNGYYKAYGRSLEDEIKVTEEDQTTITEEEEEEEE
jgi:hypothetical protein